MMGNSFRCTLALEFASQSDMLADSDIEPISGDSLHDVDDDIRVQKGLG